MSRNPDHYPCPVCGEEAVLYPDPAVPEANAHCTACDTSFSHAYDCELCGAPLFTSRLWDLNQDGPPIHQECLEAKLDSF